MWLIWETDTHPGSVLVFNSLSVNSNAPGKRQRGVNKAPGGACHKLYLAPSQPFFIFWNLLRCTQNSFIAPLTTVQLLAEVLVLDPERASEKFASGCLWLGVISNYK